MHYRRPGRHHGRQHYRSRTRVPRRAAQPGPVPEWLANLLPEAEGAVIPLVIQPYQRLLETGVTTETLDRLMDLDYVVALKFPGGFGRPHIRGEFPPDVDVRPGDVIRVDSLRPGLRARRPVHVLGLA